MATMQFVLLTLLSLSDRLEGDEDEPDLPLLSTLDFAALKDVRETGVEYCRSFEQLLHQTPGLQPGYLPAQDAQYLLSGVSVLSYCLVVEFRGPSSQSIDIYHFHSFVSVHASVA